MHNKSIVASGHKLVSEAAAAVLGEGGNAFDGIVAAGFASAIAEPALTSLGGGGFMVGRSEKHGQNMCFDFFVDTPGKGGAEIEKPDFFAVTVDFSGSSQDFNIGLGSVAVPGTLKGLLHIHRRLGRMALGDIIAPAEELAGGHILNKQQGHFLELLHPIMTLTDRSKNVYEPGGVYLRPGELLRNPETQAFLDRLVEEGEDSFYSGDIARQIDLEMREGGGYLSFEDLSSYQVKERKPLAVPYRNSIFYTAPEPSMGGSLVGLSLSLLAHQKIGEVEWGTGEYLKHTVALMEEVERLRGEGVITPEALRQFLLDKQIIDRSSENMRLFSRGTTHVSLADNKGNCASMTCSNGEGSGYLAPDTGIMLNNMMGEDDLHPGGFHSSEPGERVFSMMSPSMLLKDNQVRLVIGSGGSKRIRTAVSQVLSQVVDFDRTLEESVDAPRLYLDDKQLQLEPGFDKDAVDEVKQLLPVNEWQQKDVYFGGVHAVIPGVEGAGDKRRGGAVMVVKDD